jgi:hypothetical protein
MRLGRRASNIGALAVYVGFAALVLGRGVLAAPGSTSLGDRGADKTIFMWSLVWWPHALAHGIDPFVSRAAWAPAGIDLSWVTAIPGPSILAFPLTWMAGPIVTYNLLAILAPALAAWTAFLLARSLTGTFWPALVAGYLFGFSAYEIGQSSGHLNLTLVFLVPVCALLVTRRFAGELGRVRFVALLAAALAFQFWTSTDMFSMTLIAALIFGLLAYWRLPDGRGRLRSITGESMMALVLCGLLALPYLVHAFILTGPSYAPVRFPSRQAADLANFVIPTRHTWLQPPGSSSIYARFSANPAEAGAYLGLPLVAILLLVALRRRRPRAQSLLLLALCALCLCSLGSPVRFAGHTVAPLLWGLAEKVPIMRDVLPVRLSLFVALCAALICAYWISEGGRRPYWRWALALAAVIALLPNPSRSFWTKAVPNPVFFTSDEEATALTSADTALVLPFGKSGWSMLWQAENHMRYRMIGGYLGSRPPSEARWSGVYRALITSEVPPHAGGIFRRFLADHNANVVVIAPGTRPSVRHLVETLPVRPVHDAGVTLYRLGRVRASVLADAGEHSAPPEIPVHQATR